MAFRATEFAMFVDEEMMEAVLSGGAPSWLPHYTGDWCVHGFDPSCYPQQEVPLKRVHVTSSGVSNYYVALYSYCLAAKKTMVSGGHVALMKVQISEKEQLSGLLNGTFIARPRMHGLHVTVPLHKLHADVILHDLSNDLSESLLEVGKRFLEQENLSDGTGCSRHEVLIG